MAEKILDKCPKCSSKITNETECETCGIIFEKYFQAEARKEAEARMLKMESAPSQSRHWVILAGIILIASFVVAQFFLGQPHQSAEPAGVTIPVKTSKIPDAGGKSLQPLPAITTETPDKRLSNQDPIQRALNGTVSVRTPWGNIGSGFFIAEHSVITNKHVIMFDDAKFETLREKVERNRKLIDLEIEKIDDWKNKVKQLPPGPGRSQLELIIKNKEEDLNRVLPLQRDDEEKLDKLVDQKYSQDLRIITADNKDYPVDTILTSNSHDLALLKVYSVSGEALKTNTRNHHLKQGQAVYAIGSPMGLRNTMTSGIFSAYRKMLDTDEIYLQIDAAINPGNSGGPLIDKQGNVLGVNTMELTQAEGIGFAIPIDVVFDEFSGSL